MLTSVFHQFKVIVMNSVCLHAELGSPAHADWFPAIHPWVAGVRDFLQHVTLTQQHGLTDDQLTALDGLSAETLKDIGAPEWMQERARPARWSALDPAYWR